MRGRAGLLLGVSVQIRRPTWTLMFTSNNNTRLFLFLPLFLLPSSALPLSPLLPFCFLSSPVHSLLISSSFLSSSLLSFPPDLSLVPLPSCTFAPCFLPLPLSSPPHLSFFPLLFCPFSPYLLSLPFFFSFSSPLLSSFRALSVLVSSHFLCSTCFYSLLLFSPLLSFLSLLPLLSHSVSRSPVCFFLLSPLPPPSTLFLSSPLLSFVSSTFF